jgi:NAD(P)-dependent dehydrogenase (short-subunit alcohol dehydrogenase family)
MSELNNNTLILTAVIVGTLFAICALRRWWRKYDLSGKTVLITGRSRGLDRDEAELERARTDLLGRGADVLVVPCDVTDREQLITLVQTVCDRFAQIGVLINNKANYLILDYRLRRKIWLKTIANMVLEYFLTVKKRSKHSMN